MTGSGSDNRKRQVSRTRKLPVFEYLRQPYYKDQKFANDAVVARDLFLKF